MTGIVEYELFIEAFGEVRATFDAYLVRFVTEQAVADVAMNILSKVEEDIRGQLGEPCEVRWVSAERVTQLIGPMFGPAVGTRAAVGVRFRS